MKNIIGRTLAVGALLCSFTAATTGAEDADVLGSLPAHIAIDERLHVSAQPSAEALTKLGAAGVRTVIDLRPDAETPDLDEKAVVEKTGVVYRSLPIAGKAGLTKENVVTFDKFLGEAKEGKVLMHCASGNRVGAMMALRARWLQGKSAEEAMAIGKAAGMNGLANDVQVLLAADVVSAASPPWPPR
jgi:uncharacterized protein (TIGR01244 family)